MTASVLGRWLVGWAIATAIACIVIHRIIALDADEAHPSAIVASLWDHGELIAREVSGPDDLEPRLQAAMAANPEGTLVYESVVAQSPVLSWPEAALAVSFVPGRDGISAQFADRTAYVTPDELLNRQAYDKGLGINSIGLGIGIDLPVAMALLAERLGMTVRDMRDRVHLHRIRVVRSVRGERPPRRITPQTMTESDVRAAIIAASRYLARGVDAQGHFRYLVDASSNRTLAGYDWPRHAGATYFLALAAPYAADSDVAPAALRAASYLRDHAMVRCGAYDCIGAGGRVDVGSAALTTIAFVEIARSGLDSSYGGIVPKLTAFIRAQQRADGEFMHEYDRDANRQIDVQLLYYTGEAALALSRAHGLLQDPRDLDAATRALAHLTGPAWKFFGSRYYWGEEHWTCQAMDDLWSRAPNREALAFCLAWQAYSRKLQYTATDTPFDADGAYGLGPVVTPRLTPAGSRTEAAVATLEAARSAGANSAELDLLDGQIRRSLALLLRQQFRPGPQYLFANPAAVEGAIPGSEVDWQLRIDYLQHAGCAMVRWLELSEPRR